MFRKFAAISLAFAVATAMTLPARADALRVVVPDLAPFGSLGPDKKASGLYVDLVSAIAAKADVAISVGVAPPPRMFSGLEDGTYDAAVFVMVPPLAACCQQVAKLMDLQYVVVGAKGANFTDVASLKGKNIATVRGLSVMPAFDNDAEIKKAESTSYDMSVKVLSLGRVDGMVGTLPGVMAAFKQANLNPADFSAPLILTSSVTYLHQSKKNPSADVVAKLTAAAAALHADKTLDAIIAKYTR